MADRRPESRGRAGPRHGAGALRAVGVLGLGLMAATACGGPSQAPGPTGSGSRPAPPPASTAATASTAAPGPVARSGFIAFGDFGTGGTAQRDVAAAMRRWAAAGHRVDALVTTGDNVYPSGQPGGYRERLDQPYAGLRRPLWAALGNHDVVGGHGGQELRHLGLPAPPYARALPGLQLLFLDANRVDAAQTRWLDAHLAAPGPPFRVVVFHQPAWSCSTHGSTAAVDSRWVPVLERRTVALVLNGHDHNYQRFTSPRGVTYVVTGGGGAALYPVRAGCPGTPPRAAAAARYHFTAVEVAGRTMTVTAVTADGTAIDRAVLHRPPA
ncbi:MAG TPA: metallophosphoesterase [Streptosporangiaceae bacterium]